MSDSIVDKLAIPANALDALVRAAPDDVVRDIVNDNYRRAAPTPPAPKSIADSLIVGRRLTRYGPANRMGHGPFRL